MQQLAIGALPEAYTSLTHREVYFATRGFQVIPLNVKINFRCCVQINDKALSICHSLNFDTNIFESMFLNVKRPLTALVYCMFGVHGV